MKNIFRTFLFISLNCIALKNYCQVTYPCGVYFLSMNGSSDIGSFSKAYFGGGDYSLAAWVQLRDAVWAGKEMDIFHREVLGGFSNNDGLDFYFATNGELKFRAYTFKNGVPTQDSLASGLKPLPNIWYHVAVTFKTTGDCNIFVNGNLAASKSFGGAMSINYPYLDFLAVGGKYRFFGSTSIQTPSFKGYIDEIAVAAKALTQDQVRTLSAGIKAGDPFLTAAGIYSYNKEDNYPNNVNSGIGNGQVPVVGTLTTCPFSIPYYLSDPYPLLNSVTLSNNDDNYVLPVTADFAKMTVAKGAAADGVTRLVVTLDYNKSVIVKINNAQDGLLSTISDQNTRTLQVTADPMQDKKVRIVYFAPDGIVGNSNYALPKDISLEVADKITPSQKITIPITLVQPPLILVHDTWGTENDWLTSGFYDYLQKAGFKIIENVNYRLASSSTLDPKASYDPLGGFGQLLSAQNFILAGAQNATARMRTQGFASTRVDFLAHGIGGLRVRAYDQIPQSSSAFVYKPKVNKLITLGTPHNGTRFGPVLYQGQSVLRLITNDKIFTALDKSGALPAKVNKIVGLLKDLISVIYNYSSDHKVGEAFKDLEPDLSKNPALNNFKANTFKAYAITANYAPDAKSSFNFWNDFFTVTNYRLNHSVFNTYQQNITVKNLAAEFNNKSNDIFTTEESAAGNLSAAYTSSYPNTVHSDQFVEMGPTMTLLTNPAIRQKVEQLLLSNNKTDFAVGFPVPAGPAHARYADINNTNNPQKIQEDQASDSSYIAFDSSLIINNTYAAAAGSKIRVKINGYNGAKPENIYLLTSTLGIKKMPSSLPSEIEIDLPSSLPPGPLSLAVVAMKDSTKMYIDTLTLSILNNIVFDSITVSPDRIYLDSTIRSTQLNILGYFTDNGLVKAVNVNNYFSGSNYKSAIATISKTGNVEAKNAGLDTADIKVQGQTKRIPMAVDSNYLAAKLYENQITLSIPSTVEFDDGTIPLLGSSFAGTPLSFSKVEGSAAVFVDIVYYHDTGYIVIRASASGNSYFNKAPDLEQRINIIRARQALVFDSIPDQSLTQSLVLLNASSSSGLPVQFELVSGPARIDSNRIIFTATGLVTVRAVQNGSDRYLPASTERSFRISAGVLPLVLFDFEAVLTPENTVKLSWQTAMENNSDRFVIERSASGSVYQSISEVKSAGGSSSKTTYSFTDLKPLNGTNYYRLKMLDNDGKYSISKTIVVNVLEKIPELRIYPNPVKEVLYIRAGAFTADNVSLMITDMNGKLCRVIKLSIFPNTTYFMSLKNLAAGTYDLSFSNRNKVLHQKFVKQ